MIRAGEVFLEGSGRPGRPIRRARSRWRCSPPRRTPGSARSTLSRLVDRLAPMPEPWPDDARRRFVDLLACGHDALAGDRVPRPDAACGSAPDPRVAAGPQPPAAQRLPPLHRRPAPARGDGQRRRRCSTGPIAPTCSLVGTLLHDIGKGYPGDHTEVGIELIRDDRRPHGLRRRRSGRARRHGPAPPAAPRRRHPTRPQRRRPRSRTSPRRSAAPCCCDLLYALTEADSLATGPAAWGAWKAGLVRELVHRTDQVLRGRQRRRHDRERVPDRRAPRAARRRARPSSAAATPRCSRSHRTDRASSAGSPGVLSLHGLDVLSADAYVGGRHGRRAVRGHLARSGR